MDDQTFTAWRERYDAWAGQGADRAFPAPSPPQFARVGSPGPSRMSWSPVSCARRAKRRPAPRWAP
jgi:hypothetical protein